MRIILKHVFKSAAGNKVQVAVIVLTVIIVTAMLFVSMSMSDIFYNINMIEFNRAADGADLLIGAANGGESFSRSRVEAALSESPEDISYTEYFLKLPTIMKTETETRTVLCEATDLDEYLSRHKLKYLAKYEGTGIPGADITSEYYPVIIGETFAKNAGLSPGDTIEIYLSVYGIYSKLFVMYIAEDEGIFASAININILTDLSAVSNSGQVNAVYVHLSNPNLYDSYVEKLQEIMPSVQVGEGNSESFVNGIVKNNTMLLAIGILFIVATMAVILLTSYLIIARARTGETVVFKANGATPLQVALILIAEVVLYGAIGAAVGLLVGRFAMELAVYILLPYARAAVSYDVWKYLVSVIIAIAVTVLAALGPIIRTSKKSIRESTVTEAKTGNEKGKPILCGAALLLMAGLIAASYFVTGAVLLCVSAGVIVFGIIAAAFGVPFVIRGVSFLYSKVFRGGAESIASKTVRRSKSAKTVTVLLAVVIAFSFTVSGVIDLVSTAVTPFRTRFSADYVVAVGRSYSRDEYNSELSKYLAIEGIVGGGYYNETSFQITAGAEYGENYFSLYGVDSFDTLLNCADTNVARSSFDSISNPIVLNNDMLIRLGKKVGDRITLYPSDENYESTGLEFVIIGTDENTTEYDRVGFVKYESVEFMNKTATFLLRGNGAETFVDLRNAVEKGSFANSYALTYTEWALGGQRDLTGVITLLTALKAAMYFVAFLGLLNIAVVTVYDRREEFTLYRLSGMTDRDYIAFSVGEAAVMSFSGGFIGFFIAVAVNRIFPALAGVLNKYLSYPLVSAETAVIAAIGIVLFIIGWTGIAIIRKNTKIKSINERYQQ